MMAVAPARAFTGGCEGETLPPGDRLSVGDHEAKTGVDRWGGGVQGGAPHGQEVRFAGERRVAKGGNQRRRILLHEFLEQKLHMNGVPRQP